MSKETEVAVVPEKEVQVRTTLDRTTYIQPLHQSSVNTCLRCRRAFMFRNRWCIFLKSPSFKPAPRQGTLLHRLLHLGPDNTSPIK